MFKKLIILIILSGLGVLIWLVVLYSQIRFDINKVINYNPPLTTRFYDRNDKLIANVFKNENRLYVEYKDIPPLIIESLVAIEDTQFFEHNGINFDAIIRAIIKDLKYMKFVEGASTITQQLVKTIVLTRDKKIIRKLKEVLLSLKLESILSKEEILERYLNQVYYGHGYYGIKTAALGYFRKELSELNLKEISILVGLPKAPSFYDPTKNIKFSLSRANQVIRRLNVLGWINTKQFIEATNFKPVIYNDTLSKNKAPYIVDAAIKELTGNIDNLKTDGYKIKLTIDLEAQQIAKEALRFGYDRIKQRDKNVDTNKSTTKTLNGSIISIETNTGKILTLVGGVDYRKSSFNRVTQSQRQPGSSIKPFLYQTALNLGYSTVSNLIDISRTFEYKSKEDEVKKWKPSNYENNFKGLIPLRYSLVHSRNLATINLVTDIGIDVMYKSLYAYGFRDIPFDLSITLGSFGMSSLKLSEMYTILSNKGIKVKPYLIDSIEDKEKNVINFGPQETYISSPEQIYLMTTILQDVVTKGTGRAARVRGLETVGKTGTTNNNVDAWFCGFSPSIQTIVWYGNDDNKPMGRRETGGRTAGPVFSYFYKNWMRLHPEIKRKFDMPKEVNKTLFNGKLDYFTATSPMPKIDKIQTTQTKDEVIEF
ncbi:MAG TPA: PBP1A family penicillin-binding protein [Archaeoglobus profundus]|nr:PBP1A family penicillin-binding protein [Archaeoglobus profundus]